MTYEIEIFLIGDTLVGKTCAVKQYFTVTENDNFQIPVTEVEYETTRIMDFYRKIMTIGNENVKIQVWDTPGSEDFRCLLSNYIPTAKSVILMYDITRRSSFRSLDYWLDNIREIPVQDRPLLILVGTKSDMEEARRVSAQDVEVLREERYRDIQFVESMEISTKNNLNVDLLFTEMARLMIEKIKQDGNPRQAHFPRKCYLI